MSIEAQLKLLELYKGKDMKIVHKRMSIAELFVAQRICSQRIRLAKLKIGD